MFRKNCCCMRPRQCCMPEMNCPIIEPTINKCVENNYCHEVKQE